MRGKTKKQAVRERRKKKQLLTTLFWIGIGLVVVAAIVYVALKSPQPAIGEDVPVMPDSGHVAEGTEPGPYNSNPPTSGRHYERTLTAGFYHEADLAAMQEHPEGMLVHNLEHGYVIFWYRCGLLGDQACSDLKEQIQSVMDAYNNLKVIAFPWDSLDVPVVMTSWGRMLRFERFDSAQASDFVERNRNRAPEPDAP